MPVPFGPQLIGETEKTLNALLRRLLDGTGLTEPQWVTLRLADALAGSIDAAGLAEAVAERAHFPDAAELVRQLTTRGLLEEGQPSTAGRELLATMQAKVRSETASIWNDLPEDDVAATTRVLNEVVDRARTLLR